MDYGCLKFNMTSIGSKFIINYLHSMSFAEKKQVARTGMPPRNDGWDGEFGITV